MPMNAEKPNASATASVEIVVGHVRNSVTPQEMPLRQPHPIRPIGYQDSALRLLQRLFYRLLRRKKKMRLLAMTSLVG